MVVLEKRKVYKQPPAKYHFERRPENHGHSIVHQNTFSSVNASYDAPPFSTPLYPIAWGWNASGRAGNATEEVLREPRQVQRSVHTRYISAAAGKHHSLLVTEDGDIHSFGEGRSGQLGLGNIFVDSKVKGGIFQKIPRQVTPSGYLKDGHDLQIAQVACGATFSVAREMSTHEAVEVVSGLRKMELSLATLLDRYGESTAVQKAWAHIRHERGRINFISEGFVTAWGTGKDGQLGLGRFLLHSPAPQLVFKLRYVNVIKISAGERHVLAISKDAHLYTWGCGASGQLGHRDFENRFTPEVVQFFLPFFVEDCAGGARHSACLLKNRSGLSREEQLRRISTFGRGAHGRLGNGTNTSRHTPVLVDTFPLSTSGMLYRSVVCGGAHTMVLASKPVPKTLANPWGQVTAILAWGYGFNGQLGTGYSIESYIPVKVRMPKWEIISEISAGKSWSMARTIGGELYTWGKGWRGELGQGDDVEISLAPRKLDTFASFVKLSSGRSHNVCISAPKKYFNAASAVKAIGQDDVFKAVVDISMKSKECTSQYAFVCCRRTTNGRSLKERLRYICRTCDLISVCYDCIIHCHRGHDFVGRREVEHTPEAESKKASPDTEHATILEEINYDWNEKMKVLLKLHEARAASRNRRRRRGRNNPSPARAASASGKKRPKPKPRTKQAKAGFLEQYGSKLFQVRQWFRLLNQDENSLAEISRLRLLCCRCGLHNSKCRLLPTIPESTRQSLDYQFLVREMAASVIQRCVRGYLERMHERRGDLFGKLVRMEVCTNFYYTKILDPIWTKLRRSFDRYRERRESLQMAIEDNTKRKFDYNYVSQLAMTGMDALTYGIKVLFSRASIQAPRVRKHNESDAMFPTFVFSLHSLREMQMQLPVTCRLSPELLARCSRFFPLRDKREGRYWDVDVNLFTSKLLRDNKTIKFNVAYKEMVTQKQIAEAREKERLREEILLKREAKKNLLSQAAILMGKTPPPPPATKPPRHILAAAAEERRKESFKSAVEAIVQRDADDDAPFSQFEKRMPIPPKRRHSIADPTSMYKRITDMGPNIQMACYARRRNSLPARINQMYPTEKPPASHLTGINDSLSVFQLRHTLIGDFLDPEKEDVWAKMSRPARRRALINILAQSWLNPRLPCEMTLLLKDNSRRRSIAEPERVAQQVFTMFETRNAVEDIRALAKEKYGFPPRRRSFDFGESADESDGITSILGYNFEDIFVPPSYSDLRRDSILMDTKIVEAGYFRPSMSGGIARNLNGGAGKGSRNGANFRRPSEVVNPFPQDSSSTNVYGGDAKVWQEHYTEDGYTYYYCETTGESLWETPADGQIATQYQDAETGNWYWYNTTTGATSW